MHYIVITGGVISGLGKGTITSSLGYLLKSHGYRVTILKIDPYLNYDAGTMNPYQHGEVFVLDDGSEVDLDLGNYERFLDVNLTGNNNITTGKVYKEVIEKERKGEYLGNTVQIIPHITNEIKRRIRMVANTGDYDVVLIEVGGTVGDMESMPFLEAIRQLNREEGRGSFVFGHVTLVPELGVVGEQKTKPTQHSVRDLREIGITPDILFCRATKPLSLETKKRISLFTDVAMEGIVSVNDVPNVYLVPDAMEKQGIVSFVKDKLSLPEREYHDSWAEYKDNIRNPREKVKIALVGKYIELQDSYMSHKEAFSHVKGMTGIDVEIKWVNSDDLMEDQDVLSDVQGVIVPGGFGYRGIEGKIKGARYARENGIPYLGICLGFQVAIMEFARNVMGLEGANSAEFDSDTKYPVIDLLPEQQGIEDLGGTMRLGAKKVIIKDNTLARKIYGSDTVYERHRHRYEVNPKFIGKFNDAGMVFSGVDEEGIRMEIAELKGNDGLIAVQYHSEFKSRPLEPSKVHMHLVKKALEYKEKTLEAAA